MYDKDKTLPDLFAGVNSALIMTIGGFSIMEGVMTVSIYMAFLNILNQFHEPFGKLTSLGTTLQTTEMQMQRLDDVRRYQIDSLNYPKKKEYTPFPNTRLSVELELKNVNFGYSPLSGTLLENFNFHIEPGHFMNYYKDAFIDPAYARLMPIAVKMTMVLWYIDTAMKVALGLTQQDLVNFFTKQILKLGIYIFLITNWWSPIGSSQAKDLSEKAGGSMQIMAVLGDGFENLGYYAAGGKEDNLKNSDGEVGRVGKRIM